MGKIAAICVLFVLFGITGAASATIFTIELPELVGELESYPNNPTVAFDFETPFLSIEEARIHLIGTASEGLAYGDGIFNPSDKLFNYLPFIEIFMYPDTGSCYTHTYSLDGLFDIDIPFALKYGATWDFLLDGQGQITANRARDNILLGPDVEPASVEIFEAHLVVEGTIPEPCSLVLLGSGFMGIILARKKDASVASI
jgi:hypothetical protein